MSDLQAEAMLPPAEEWGQFRAFLLGRVGICLAIICAIVVASLTAGATPRIWWVLAPVFLVMLLTVPYWRWARRLPGSIRRAYVFILSLDIVLTTLGAYLLGGENTVYGLAIYSIYVAMAAAILSWRGVFWTAGVGAAAYATMAIATGGGWIPEQPSAFAFRFSDAWWWMTTIVNTFQVLAIAIVAGSLGHVTRASLLRSRVLEQRLRDTNASLESRIESAVREIRASNLSLEAKHEALSRTLHQVELFARAVSHDLRKPITGASEALRLSGASESSRREKLLDLTRENLLRADRMLMGLRDLMRSIGGRTSTEAVDVRSLLEDVIEELSVARAGASLPVELIGEFGECQAQPDQMAHVFRNLIANALEHNAGQASLRVEVGREGEADPGFFVRDNGVGIPVELRGRILAPFHRGPGGPEGGLGLGLALVDAIVTQTGGKVWLESTSGGGATVRFTFPPKEP